MKNNLLSAGILGIGLGVSLLIIANGAFAQTATVDSIQYPIAELGNCTDKDSCKTYCDNESHLDACLAFAEKNNLMSSDDINAAKKFAEAGNKGPGGCTGKDECQNYCDNVNHIDECVAFAEKTGMLPPDQLAEAKQVQTAIAKGVKPPACNGKKACDAYCEAPSHMEECVAFGEAAGFLQGKDLEDAKKVLTAVAGGATPPACKGKDACDAYCSEPNNIEACVSFAQAAGLMTPEEAQNSQKMIEAVKKGVKPPACRGKEECDAYCQEPAHTDECIQFAVAAGMMTEKDAEMARKTGGKGPGGCSSKETCDAFCGDPANQQTCMDFAKENGFDVGPDGQGGGQQGQINEQLQPWKDMCSNNTELACADDAGNFVADAKIGADKQPVCPTGSTAKCGNYPQIHQQGQNQRGQSGNKFQSGPGTGGQQMPQQAGPGGCKGQEECTAYCKDHLKECQEFVPSSGGGPNEGQGFNPGSGVNGNGPGLRDSSTGQQQQQQQNQQQGQQQPGEQFAPGTYPNQPPSGTQYGPGAYPDQGPLPEGTSGAYPDQQMQYAPGEIFPQAAPIESTAPQSSNFDLNSSLAAIAAIFGVSF